MPYKRCGYIVAEADVVQWGNSRMTHVPEMAEYKPWLYALEIKKAFDAHPKDVKESFDEIFPDDSLYACSILQRWSLGRDSQCTSL
jgi:hypothetical protein